jgi:hypothetical protein
MWRLASVVLVLAACNSDVEHEATAATPVAVAQAHVAGRPHSANIREVAATEQGDAAVSVDTIGGVRVWPALDGSSEPVAISVPAPMQLAIASTAGEVTVGVLDQAGSAHVLRIGRDGVVRGNTEVAGDVPITQLVAAGDRLLALRADQSIEELDASGAVRTRLVADPGDRIAGLAVRTGGVLAVLAADDGTASSARWIDHGRWGARVKLPGAVAPESVALSPSHRWLAAAEASSHQMFVYDLSVQPALATTTAIQMQPGEATGFVDDHELAALSPLQWWTIGSASADPWAVTTPASPATIAGAAANGVVIAPSGPELALLTPTSTRYLGWAEMNPSIATVVGDGIAIATSGTHYAWLDRSLVERRAGDLHEENVFGMPIDDRHVLVQHPVTSGRDVKLVDFDHPDRSLMIGHFDDVYRLGFAPRTQDLFLEDGTMLHRFRLDLAHDAVTELPGTKRVSENFQFEVDPAAVGGALAIAWALEEGNRTRIDELRDEGGKLVRKKLRVLHGFVASVDAHGGVWWRDQPGGPIHHGNVTLPAAPAVVPDHAGLTALETDGTTLALYAADGTERWRVPAWRVTTVAFTADDRQVLVHGLGGVVLLDAATGERVAAACGWQFGLRDHAPAVSVPGSASVCEDSER